MRALLVGLLVGATLLPGPQLVPMAWAQGQATDDRPYDGKLMRLSELLGAVHYLRELCGADEGQIWRQQMQEILQSEGTTAIRRAKLKKSFNRGYRGYRRTYRNCNKSAALLIDRFMREAALLAETLAKSK